MDITLFILKKAPAWFVSWSFRKIFGNKNLAVFERLLELPKWEKILPDHPQKWIFTDDNSFTIEVSGESREFVENWTKRFLDQKAYAVDIYLKISGELVAKPLLFVGVDGWRNFVPLPRQAEDAEGDRYFYFDKNSLEFKVFERIGFLDSMYKDIGEFGRRCGVLVE